MKTNLLAVVLALSASADAVNIDASKAGEAPSLNSVTLFDDFSYEVAP